MRDHPRIRGEHLTMATAPVKTSGSSPHTRGARLHWSPLRWRQWDHPRIRGEHSDLRVVCQDMPGSSPHTRGALTPVSRCLGVLRIIPAYAGSTVRRLRRPGRPQDHPRIRGEHVKLSYL